MFKTADNRLLEPQIKALVLNYLMRNKLSNPGSFIINELTVDRFSRRTDLVLVTNSRLIAIEIKSEADSLKRLQEQTSKYLEHFDKAIVVADAKHIDKILGSTPSQIGVWEVSKKSIIVRRRGSIRPIRDKKKILSLLRKNELLALARNHNIQHSKESRTAVESSLNRIPLKSLKAFTLKNLNDRFQSTYSKFIEQVGDTLVQPDHIELLSSYKGARLAHKKLIEKREFLMEGWVTSVNNEQAYY